MEPIAAEEVNHDETVVQTDEIYSPSRLECLGGVIVSPLKTFEYLSEKPQWFLPLLVIILYVLVSSVVRSATMFVTMLPKAPKALGAEGGVTFNLAFGALLSTISLVFYVASALLIFLAMAAALYAIAKAFKGAPKFSILLSTLAFAEFVPRLVSVSLKEFIPLLSGSSRPFAPELPTGIAPIFSGFDVPMVAQAFLARIELFHLWSFALVAMAVRFTAKVSSERAMLITLLYWIVCILAVAGGDAFREMLRSLMMGG
jgi:hypothetical protein